MTDQLVPIAIHHALPLNSENRWSDVLAVLIETDPGPICELLDLGIEPSAVAVKREVSLDKANRPDLILHANGSTVAVIEVKLLSGLGVKQLDRYLEAEPNADPARRTHHR